MITGYPFFSAKLRASSKLVNSAQRGCPTHRVSRSEENLLRSSARSIFFGEVQRTCTPAFSSLRARLFAICPPIETITPIGFSVS